MGMSHDEFKTAFLRDQAERKMKHEREYDNYFSIVVYKMKKSKINTWKKNQNLNISYNSELYGDGPF